VERLIDDAEGTAASISLMRRGHSLCSVRRVFPSGA
jgi:hypothetical protein